MEWYVAFTWKQDSWYIVIIVVIIFVYSGGIDPVPSKDISPPILFSRVEKKFQTLLSIFNN